MSVDGSSQQCSERQHCRFMAQASSVLQDNIVGLLITDNVLQDNTVGSLLTGSDGPFTFYCFITDFNLYFFVESGFALYTLRSQQDHQY